MQKKERWICCMIDPLTSGRVSGINDDAVLVALVIVRLVSVPLHEDACNKHNHGFNHTKFRLFISFRLQRFLAFEVESFWVFFKLGLSLS